jgi:hypothetical protein
LLLAPLLLQVLHLLLHHLPLLLMRPQLHLALDCPVQQQQQQQAAVLLHRCLLLRPLLLLLHLLAALHWHRRLSHPLVLQQLLMSCRSPVPTRHHPLLLLLLPYHLPCCCLLELLLHSLLPLQQLRPACLRCPAAAVGLRVTPYPPFHPAREFWRVRRAAAASRAEHHCS